MNVNFFSRFLDSDFRARADAVDAQLAAARRAATGADGADSAARLSAMRDSLLAAIPPTPFAVLIDHIDHVARVAGVDHVGLGSDFDGVSALPQGMEDVTRLPALTAALLERGYSEAVLEGILGGNWKRVFKANWSH